MKRRTAAARSFGFVLSLLGHCSDAFAEMPGPPRSERERIHIDYEADASCPGYDAFIESVRVYTSRWVPAREGEDARRFRVTIGARDGKVAGTLELAPGSGNAEASAAREIAGPDCEVVARGMAVAVALAIDPEALMGSPPETVEATPTADRAPAPSSSSPRAPRAGRPAPRPEPRFAVDARVEVTSAVVSGWLAVFGASIEVDPLARRVRAPGWSRPSFAVGIRQSSTAERERSTLTTELVWTAGVARLCPVRLALAEGRLELTPCLEGDVGVLRATASGSSDARSSSRLWVDAGASAHATWRIAGPWFVGAASFMVVPVSRNRFELGNGALVSQAPRLAINLGISGGLRF